MHFLLDFSGRKYPGGKVVKREVVWSIENVGVRPPSIKGHVVLVHKTFANGPEVLVGQTQADPVIDMVQTREDEFVQL